jgi:translation initiation factor 5B
VDKLPGWNPGYGSITNGMKRQNENILRDLDNRIYELVSQLYRKGFQSERFDRITDFTKQIPIIPGSAKLGEGLAETLVFLAGLSQRFMEKKLTIEVSGPGKGTILEIKEEKGLGKTVDVILYDGELKVGNEIVLGGKRGIIRTRVRALLEPKPLNEIRDPKEKFNNVKEVHAAAGVKVAAPDLDEALAGSPLLVASNHEEENRIKEELNEIEVEQDSNGPIIRTDSLGALEALVKLLAEKKINPRAANVGEVTRKDVIEAHSVAEKEPFKGVIFAFNSRVLPEAEEESKKCGVHIFKQNVIYKLLEDYAAWVEETQNAEKQKILASLVFPARIRLLPNFVFRNSRPAIVGVRVLEGKLKVDAPLMRPDGKIIGKVLGIQHENQAQSEAKKNAEVAVSIDEATIGRDIKEEQELLVFLSDENIARLEKIGNELSLEEKELLEEVKKIKQKRGDAE